MSRIRIINKLGIEGEDKWFQLFLCFVCLADGLLNMISIWFGYRISLAYYCSAIHYNKQFNVLQKAKKIIEKDKR